VKRHKLEGFDRPGCGCATGCETTVKQNAIAANLAAMSEMLAVAAARAAEAHQVMQAGEQNQAVGTVMGLDRELEDALALYRAAIALHKGGRQ